MVKLCGALTKLLEDLEDALTLRNRALRREIETLVRVLTKAGNRIENICNEEHENELKNKNQYFS